MKMNRALSSTNTIILSKIKHRTFGRHELISEESKEIWQIQRGIVRAITWDENGECMTLGYWGTGDIIGYSLSCVSPYHLECLTHVEVTSVPLQTLSKNLDVLLSHIQHTEQLISIVNCKGASTRIWQFLLWLSDRFGRDMEKGRLIDIQITHQEIADVLNTTRVTITRMLKDLENEGKLQRHKRMFILMSA
jgi:CRP-like cAMP-binding protein